MDWLLTRIPLVRLFILIMAVVGVILLDCFLMGKAIKMFKKFF